MGIGKGNGIRLGKLIGIPIILDYSVFISVALITILLGTVGDLRPAARRVLEKPHGGRHITRPGHLERRRSRRHGRVI